MRQNQTVKAVSRPQILLPIDVDLNEVSEQNQNLKFALANIYDVKRVLGEKKLDRKALVNHCKRETKYTDFILKVDELRQSIAARQATPIDKMIE